MLHRLAIIGLLLPIGLSSPGSADDTFFESRIRPVLVKHCYECHSGDADVLQAGLRLDEPDAMREGGDSGPVIVPGEPGDSLLLASLKYEGSEMPPSGKLDDQIVRDFETWIKRGAPDPRARGEAPAEREPEIDWDQAKQFWAFRTPVAVDPPESPFPSNHLIDRFIGRRLADEGLAPARSADRRTLLRRVTFDLTGLPPTTDEVNAFLNDRSPDAYERVVERLLSSPAHGEHWTRMWLDVARYAEDQAHKVGNNNSLTYPNAYRYRDWVINAIAGDIGYDDFVRMQLAADHYAADDREAHLALGFLGLGPKYYRRNAPEVMADEWEDRIDTVSRGLLGLTVACARCHDHKYDPIPTADYYSLAGVFASTEMFNRPIDESVKSKNGQASQPQDAEHIVRDGTPKDLNVMLRGDVERQGDLAPRQFLTALSSEQPRPLTNGSGRTDLAEAIVDRNNPLTSRVIVNRVWRQLMGRGFVETPSNFGSLGDPPRHPELLDTLAVGLMENDWSLKWLQREIVLSSTYRQSGDAGDVAMEVDPENRLYWRMTPKRLSIEAYRDAVLSVSGNLDREIGGKSIRPDAPESTRRTVYSEVSRLDLNPLLARFDFPDPNAHSAKRVETTTPLQKLFLMNSDFILRHAEQLADRAAAADDSPGGQIEFLYQQLFSRTPSAEEREWATKFVSSGDRARWNQLAQILLISNEMLFVD